MSEDLAISTDSSLVRWESVLAKTVLRIGIGSIALYCGVSASSAEQRQDNPFKSTTYTTACGAQTQVDRDRIPARIRNRKSPKPKRGFYGTREQGERLALVLMVEDLSDMKPKHRPLVLGSMPVPGYRLEGTYDDTGTGLFVAHILHSSSGIHYIVFLGVNKLRDYGDGRKFSWTGDSDQHSARLFSIVLGAFGLVSEANQLSERVHFVGHSLGGSLAIVASAQFGIPSEYTVFNSLGIHRTLLGEVHEDLSGEVVYSSTDVLRVWNGLNRLRLPGTLLRIPRAGLHKPFPMCRYMKYCREPVWRVIQETTLEERVKGVEAQNSASRAEAVDTISEETSSKTIVDIDD